MYNIGLHQPTLKRKLTLDHVCFLFAWSKNFECVLNRNSTKIGFFGALDFVA